MLIPKLAPHLDDAQAPKRKRAEWQTFLFFGKLIFMLTIWAMMTFACRSPILCRNSLDQRSFNSLLDISRG